MRNRGLEVRVAYDRGFASTPWGVEAESHERLCDFSKTDLGLRADVGRPGRVDGPLGGGDLLWLTSVSVDDLNPG